MNVNVLIKLSPGCHQSSRPDSAGNVWGLPGQLQQQEKSYRRPSTTPKSVPDRQRRQRGEGAPPVTDLKDLASQSPCLGAPVPIFEAGKSRANFSLSQLWNSNTKPRSSFSRTFLFFSLGTAAILPSPKIVNPVVLIVSGFSVMLNRQRVWWLLGRGFISTEERIVVLEKLLVHRLEWSQPRRLHRKRWDSRSQTY